MLQLVRHVAIIINVVINRNGDVIVAKALSLRLGEDVLGVLIEEVDFTAYTLAYPHICKGKTDDIVGDLLLVCCELHLHIVDVDLQVLRYV